MKTVVVVLTLFGFLGKFSTLGLPRVDYNQHAMSLDQRPSLGIIIITISFSLSRVFNLLVISDTSDVVGCCPTILEASSEIAASGCEVQVRIFISNTPSKKEPSTQQVMQNCTTEDHKFMYTLPMILLLLVCIQTLF